MQLQIGVSERTEALEKLQSFKISVEQQLKDLSDAKVWTNPIELFWSKLAFDFEAAKLQQSELIPVSLILLLVVCASYPIFCFFLAVCSGDSGSGREG